MNNYRRFHEKSSHRHYFIPIVVIIVIIGGFIFLKHNSFITTAQQLVPVPTALDPNFSKQVNECFIPTAAIYGYTLRVTAGFRSLPEQALIYNSGRTVDGHIVTWAEPGRSLHNYGFAVDVVDRWKGYNIDFDKLAKIVAYCGLEQVDPPHFEHRAGLTTDQFEAGMRPPPLTLPCAIMDERARVNQKLTLKDLEDNNCGVPKFL